MTTDWTVGKLVNTSKAFDSAAQRGRKYYSSYRRMAFTARRWARRKEMGELDD